MVVCHSCTQLSWLSMERRTDRLPAELYHQASSSGDVARAPSPTLQEMRKGPDCVARSAAARSGHPDYCRRRATRPLHVRLRGCLALSAVRAEYPWHGPRISTVILFCSQLSKNDANDQVVYGDGGRNMAKSWEVLAPVSAMVIEA